MSNGERYGDLSSITDIICEKRVQLSDHCWRSKQSLASAYNIGSKLWEKIITRKKKHQLSTHNDIGNKKETLGRTIEERNCWKEVG